MQKSYGNIRDTKLVDAVNTKGFKELWKITKDHVAVCKDCEFRYICQDCRAILKDPENIYSKPGNCKYNLEATMFYENFKQK